MHSGSDSSLVGSLLDKISHNFGYASFPHCTQTCKANTGNQADYDSVRKLQNSQPIRFDDDDEEDFRRDARTDEVVMDLDAIRAAIRSSNVHHDAKDASLMYELWSESGGATDRAALQPTATPPRVWLAPAVPPQDLHFLVPPDVGKQHQSAVCVNGPHGPIMVELPEDAVPGEQRSWRLGPVGQKVVVPEGASEGVLIDHEVEGVVRQVAVPPGVAPGESFEVVPPALVVMVPQGVQSGDFLEFPGINGEMLKVLAPEGLKAGQYFSLLL